MPKVSIIIPCYNGEKYIAHCIKSLLNQSFRDLEVIVVNDGSTDRTEKICLKIKEKDNRLKLISKKNEGRMLARYTGYKEAEGDYVGFSDADDYHPQNSIKNLIDLAENYSLDCVIGQRAVVQTSIPIFAVKWKSLIGEKLIERDSKWISCYGFANNINIDDNISGVMWGRLYRKKCIDKALEIATPSVVFPKALLEDWWFTLVTMSYMDRFYVTNDIVYYYRTGGSTSGDFPMLEKSNDYYNYRFNFFDSFKSSKEEFHKRTFVCFVQVLFWELSLKINSNKYTDDRIIDFIETQLSNNKIVDWAVKNPEQLPEALSEKIKLVINRNADQILSYANEQFHYKNVQHNRFRISQLFISIKSFLRKLIIEFCKLIDKIRNFKN